MSEETVDAENNDSDGKFIIEGLVHYGAAVRAVNELGRRLPPLLEQALAAHDAIAVIKLAEGWRTSLRPTVKPNDEPYICVTADARLDGEAVRVELGMWWYAPGGAPTAIYVGLHDAKPIARALAPTRGTTTKYGDKYLIAPFTPIGEGSSTFEVAAEQLLAEFDEALKVARA